MCIGRGGCSAVSKINYIRGHAEEELPSKIKTEQTTHDAIKYPHKLYSAIFYYFSSKNKKKFNITSIQLKLFYRLVFVG